MDGASALCSVCLVSSPCEREIDPRNPPRPAVALASLAHVGFEIGLVQVNGLINKKVMSVAGAGGVDLQAPWTYSAFFGGLVVSSYHPTLMMRTRNTRLRSLFVLRTAIVVHRVSD